jgi:hypothetical protein
MEIFDCGGCGSGKQSPISLGILSFQANADLKVFFSMAVVIEIGDGINTLF